MTTRHHLVLDADPLEDMSGLVEAYLGDPAVTGTTFFMDAVEFPAPSLTHYVFLEEEGRARVVLVLDRETPVQYLVVEAHDPADADRIAEALARKLPVVAPERLRDAADANLDEDPGSLVRMAIGAPRKADPETVGILTRGLVSPERDTRINAIEAASLTQWPELEEPLARAQESEKDPELREFAGTALESLRQDFRKS